MNATTTAAAAHVHVRPAWGVDAPPLSARAMELLVAEWRALGLLGDEHNGETDTASLLRGVQERGGKAAARSRAGKPHLKLVTTSDAGADIVASESVWPSFVGRLLRYGESAITGKDSAGHYVREKFRPGALAMPEDGAPVLLNKAHQRDKVAGHVTGLSTVGDEVHVRGVIVDTVTDGHEAMELARAGSVQCLSVEFMSLGAPSTTITREASGRQMVEHSRVLLVGVGLVPVGAYRSARLLRLLDRRELGREREAVRRRALASLSKIGAEDGRVG